MSSRIAAFVLPFVAFAPAGFAQSPIVVRGEINSAAGSHTIKFTNVPLTSATINLNLFDNDYVMLTGTWNGSVINVTGAQFVAETFSVSGNGHIGDQFVFTTHAALGSFAVNVIAFSTGVTLLGDQGLLLSTSNLGILGSGFVAGDAEFKSPVAIPNSPGLVGLQVFGQSLVMPPAAPFFLSNLDSKVIDD